jgi:hypothetical protein
MEPIILHLPIKYETLINTIYGKCNIEDFLNEYENKEVESEVKVDLYKIGENETDLGNKQVFSDVINKTKIIDTIIDINYNNQDFTHIKPYNISIDTIKKSKTDISCWWCCHKFDNYPISLPIKFYPENKLFKCKGIFCSFPCAMSYAQLKKHDYSLLKMLYRQLLNLKYADTCSIKKAPPKEILQMFGGPISIEEYRKNSGTDNLYNITTYPIVFINQQLHLKSQYGENNKDSNSTKRVLNNNMITEAQQRLLSNTTQTGKGVVDKLNKVKIK